MSPPAPISVVIPACDAECFIAQTIESVHAQTLQVAEVIVIDDGSSDRTAEVARAARARVMTQPNRGLSAARNTGIKAATQPWVALLDADDVWTSDKVARQWEAVNRCPEADLVSCDYYYIDGRGNPLDAPRPDGRLRARYRRTHGTSAGRSSTLFRRADGELFNFFLPLPSTLLAKREAFFSVGLFDERLRRCEDVECFLRLLAGRSLLVVDQPLVGYRQHETNLSNDKALMRSAVADVLGMMIARPDVYAVGAREAVENWLRRSRVEIGRELLEVGEPARARALLRQALAEEFTRRTALLIAFTYVPTATFKYFLELKRALVRRGVIDEAIELCLWRCPQDRLAAEPTE